MGKRFEELSTKEMEEILKERKEADAKAKAEKEAETKENENKEMDADEAVRKFVDEINRLERRGKRIANMVSEISEKQAKLTIDFCEKMNMNFTEEQFDYIEKNALCADVIFNSFSLAILDKFINSFK